ncbi:MAG: hypothetical protein COY58_00255 [Gammaproteobacteria bacterium CG_4_10_14_0_8_um_filter_38_16]|nr:MAG: hypothetical protein COY58_00255 [Gammaproteobacteria bacterium CG_4_10_14_0_8_um_filter_38_16]PJA02773.1 MAG: hypothetical protein COX72_08260 [Gammaproteobacteria bacterium CG_4_10_14_0_2_um_filter_38_22]PJB10736.1 MAG: hypothetical protein CO120_03455 [Gammaproteobacteria bacterium CG_4_9_14_3_um_filter_38_9]
MVAVPGVLSKIDSSSGRVRFTMRLISFKSSTALSAYPTIVDDLWMLLLSESRSYQKKYDRVCAMLPD